MSDEQMQRPEVHERRDDYPPMIDADADSYIDREPTDEDLPIIEPPPRGASPPQPGTNEIPLPPKPEVAP